MKFYLGRKREEKQNQRVNKRNYWTSPTIGIVAHLLGYLHLQLTSETDGLVY
jgi:hypothetical protein